MPGLVSLRVLFVAAYALGCSGGGSTSEQRGKGGSEAQSGGGAGKENGGSNSGGSTSGGANGTCGAQTCGAEQFCCGPSDCGFCAPMDSGVFCGFACENGGAGGSSAGGAAQTGGQANVDPDCTKPAGTDVTATDYSFTTANGCFASVTIDSTSITISDEQTFKTTFNCPADGTSGIDFSSQRLHVTVFPSFSIQPRKWAVEDDQAVHIGYDNPPICGGAFPPNVQHLTLLPAGPKPVKEDLCGGSCNFGSGGFPPL